MSFKKKLLSSAQAVYKNSCLKIFKPLTFGLFLTNIKNISNTSIDKYAISVLLVEHLLLI